MVIILTNNVVIFVCLFVCPIITRESLEHFALILFGKHGRTTLEATKSGLTFIAKGFIWYQWDVFSMFFLNKCVKSFVIFHLLFQKKLVACMHIWEKRWTYCNSGRVLLIFYDQQFKDFLDRWDHSYQGESCPLSPPPIFNPTVGL